MTGVVPFYKKRGARKQRIAARPDVVQHTEKTCLGLARADRAESSAVTAIGRLCRPRSALYTPAWEAHGVRQRKAVKEAFRTLQDSLGVPDETDEEEALSRTMRSDNSAEDPPAVLSREPNFTVGGASVRVAHAAAGDGSRYAEVEAEAHVAMLQGGRRSMLPAQLESKESEIQMLTDLLDGQQTRIEESFGERLETTFRPVNDLVRRLPETPRSGGSAEPGGVLYGRGHDEDPGRAPEDGWEQVRQKVSGNACALAGLPAQTTHADFLAVAEAAKGEPARLATGVRLVYAQQHAHEKAVLTMRYRRRVHGLRRKTGLATAKLREVKQAHEELQKEACGDLADLMGEVDNSQKEVAQLNKERIATVKERDHCREVAEAIERRRVETTNKFNKLLKADELERFRREAVAKAAMMAARKKLKETQIPKAQLKFEIQVNLKAANKATLEHEETTARLEEERQSLQVEQEKAERVVSEGSRLTHEFEDDFDTRIEACRQRAIEAEEEIRRLERELEAGRRDAQKEVLELEAEIQESCLASAQLRTDCDHALAEAGAAARRTHALERIEAKLQRKIDVEKKKLATLRRKREEAWLARQAAIAQEEAKKAAEAAAKEGAGNADKEGAGNAANVEVDDKAARVGAGAPGGSVEEPRTQIPPKEKAAGDITSWGSQSSGDQEAVPISISVFPRETSPPP
eukprot:Hpha_TRINITY_DN30077_c0_g1::TRINITY_DN30077_c0_g1_i1::g.21578::m.21578